MDFNQQLFIQLIFAQYLTARQASKQLEWLTLTCLSQRMSEMTKEWEDSLRTSDLPQQDLIYFEEIYQENLEQLSLWVKDSVRNIPFLATLILYR